MTLRTRFFALTYDRQMAKTEKAGLRAFRRGPAGRGGRRCAGDRQRDRGEPALLRPGRRVTDDDRARSRRCCAAWSARPASRRPAAKVLRAPAEDLPFDDGTFDVAVSTLVLCGVDDQPRALRELRRVLRPGGQLLFIEHVRSDDPRTARLQDRMNWLNRLVVCCDCNRPTLDSIQGSRLHHHAGRAHRAAEGPQVRQPRHHRHRHGPGRRAFQLLSAGGAGRIRPGGLGREPRAVSGWACSRRLASWPRTPPVSSTTDSTRQFSDHSGHARWRDYGRPGRRRRPVRW